MRILGLTGGIAAGKSLVARRLVELGAVHVDADFLAREVVEPGTPGLEAIRERFGDGVLAADGTLDRAALGAIVFTDPEAREALNRITHPAVWRRAQQRFDEAAATDPDAIVVYDVPLLVEGAGKRAFDFDRVVVVHAGHDERVRRLVELRGMTPEEAVRRIDAQASDAERLAVADTVIDANGTIEQTLQQVDALWQDLHPAV
jgi:dephospho-CoA kinase